MARNSRIENLPVIGTVLAGLAASLCCIVPLVLVMLGLGGAWMSVFSAMEPWRPLFLGLTAVFVIWGWYRLYRHPQSCAPDGACAVPADLHHQRILFWMVTVFIALLIAFPWYAHWII